MEEEREEGLGRKGEREGGRQKRGGKKGRKGKWRRKDRENKGEEKKSNVFSLVQSVLGARERRKRELQFMQSYQFLAVPSVRC